MPEFPLRLQFTVEIDISGSSSTSRANTAGDAPSTVVIEVNVRNVKSSQAEEAVGACFCVFGDRFGVYDLFSKDRILTL